MIVNRSINIKNALKSRFHRQKFETALTAFWILLFVENDLQRIQKNTIELDYVNKKNKFSHKRHDKKFQNVFEDCLKKKINEWIAENAWTRTKEKSNFLNRKLFNVSFSSCLQFIFAFINHCLQHFSFMKDDRFRWISERISHRIRFRFWIDRNDRFHD